MAAAAFPRCVPVCRMRRRLSLSGLPNESGNLRRLLVSMGNRNHPVRRTSGLAPALDMAAAHRPGGMKPPRFEVLTDLKRMWNVPAWKRWRMVCMRKRTGVQGACRRGKGDFRAPGRAVPRKSPYIPTVKCCDLRGSGADETGGRKLRKIGGDPESLFPVFAGFVISSLYAYPELQGTGERNVPFPPSGRIPVR